MGNLTNKYFCFDHVHGDYAEKETEEEAREWCMDRIESVLASCDTSNLDDNIGFGIKKEVSFMYELVEIDQE